MKYALMIVLFFAFGCVEQTALDNMKTISSKPDNNEITAGLKEALKTGVLAASSELSASGGYYKNEAYKILLPPEASDIISNISKIPGGQKMVDDVVLRLNSAAESAAKKSAPIFTDAITKMTLQDAMGILSGGENAATNYLKQTTSLELKNAYRPEIEKALTEPLVAGISAQDSWGLLSTNYNKVAQSLVGKLSGMDVMDTTLDEYVLDEATNALFSRIGIEEAKIRKNPLAYTSSIIKKVFSYGQTLK